MWPCSGADENSRRWKTGYDLRMKTASLMLVVCVFGCSGGDGGDSDGSAGAASSGGSAGVGAGSSAGGSAGTGGGSTGTGGGSMGTGGGSTGTGGGSTGTGGAGGGPGTGGSSNGAGEPAALMGMTDLHNQVRATVNVAPLVWDPGVAAVAQAWAESCTDNSSPQGLVDHNMNRHADYGSPLGENIFGAGGTATPSRAVESWASEEADYDYDSNSCATGKSCGHYTQIVWANSRLLGCGIADCPGLRFGSTIVCNYSPPGNAGNQKPY